MAARRVASVTDDEHCPTGRLPPPALEPADPNHYNQTGFNFRAPMPRPKVRGTVVDFHCHLLANRHAPAERYRFSLAHEPGHLVLHQSPGDSSVQERQADEFAAEFLMPARDIRSAFTPRVGLSYRLRDVLSAGVGMQRDVERSFYADRSHYLYTLYEASVRQALFHHFDVGASFQYTFLDYRQFLLSGQPLVELPTEEVRMTSVNGGMPITRGFRAGWPRR